MQKYTTVIQEVVDRGKYRYGLLKIKSSDLLPLIGKKVHVIVLSEGKETSVPKSEDVGTDVCAEFTELENELELLAENYVYSARNRREQSRRNGEVEKIKQILGRMRRRLGCV